MRNSRITRFLQSAAILGFGIMLCAALANAQSAAEQTFKMKCAACHGADGKGDTGAGKALGVHDMTSESVQKMSDTELADIISKGKNKMPAYGKTMKESEIKDLVDYVRELGKKK